MRFLAVVMVSLGASVAWAQPAPQATPELLAGAYRCAALQDDSARLACYDEAVGRLRQAETEGQIVAVDRTQAATIERDAFGFNLPSLAALIPRFGGGNAARAEIENVEMQVERVVERANGRHSFVMSNGQTWTQVESQSARNVRPGDTIRVRRAALGSFMLSPEHGAGHRVRREN